MKTHVSTYGKGLNKDISLDAMPSDMYLHAEDIRFFTDEGSSLAAGINIKGTSQIFQLLGTGEQVIGFTTIRNKIVFFTADNTDAHGRIYELVIDDKTNLGTPVLIYDHPTMGFKKASPIEAIGVAEDSCTERVVFSDYADYTRSINILDDCFKTGAYTTVTSYCGILPNDLDINQGFCFNNPVVDDVIGGGSLLTGMYQYAFRLITRDGKQTLISQATPLISIYPKDADRNIDLEGDEEDVVAGKSVKLKFDLSNVDLSNIQNLIPIRLFINTINGLPEVTQFPEISIDPLRSDYTFIDSGNNLSSEITNEQYILSNFAFKTNKTFAVKDNLLLYSNIKENCFELSCIDKEDFVNIRYNGGTNNVTYITSSYPSITTDPIEARYINPFNDETGSIFGHDTSPLATQWQGPHQFRNQTPTGIVGGTTVSGYLNYKFCLEEMDVVGTSDTSSYSLNDGYSHKSITHDAVGDPVKGNEVRGYKRGEVYRFGIVFFSKDKGQASFVYPIGDIKFPSISQEAGYETISGTGITNFPVAIGSNLYALGVEFDLNLPQCLKDQICGYQIVRVDRDYDNKSYLSQGVIQKYHAVGDDPDLGSGAYSYLAMPNLDTIFEYADEFPLGSDRKTLVSYLSPEISYNVNSPEFKSGDYLKSVGIANNSTQTVVSSSGQTVDIVEVDKIPHDVDYLHKEPIADAERVVCGTGDRRLRYVNNVPVRSYSSSTTAYSNSASAGAFMGTNMICQLKKIQNNGSAASPFLYQGTTAGTGVYVWRNSALMFPIIEPKTGTGTYVIDYARPLLNQYGGRSYSVMSRNVFHPCSNVIDVAETTPKVYQGDTFIGYYDFATHIYDDNYVAAFGFGSSFYETVRMPVETSINLDLTHGFTAHKNTGGYDHDNNGVYDSYRFKEINNQRGDMFKYNTVFSQSRKDKSFFAQPLDYDVCGCEITRDVRTYISDPKINGETIDSWSNIRINNYRDIDSAHGAINKLLTLRDEVFFLQDGGFGYFSINPRAVITTNDGSPTELGSGAGLADHKYISTAHGCKHQWGCVATDSGIFYFDSENKKIYNYSGTDTPISDMKGFHGFLNYRLKGDVLLSKSQGGDNPILDKGVHCTFDYNKKELIWTFLGTEDSVDRSGFTLVLDTKTQAFSHFLNHTPRIYLNDADYILSSKPLATADNLHVHETGVYGSYYGDAPVEAMISVVVNAQGDINKILRYIEFNSTVNALKEKGSYYGDRVDEFQTTLRDETITGLRIYNEHQDSGKINLSDTRQFKGTTVSKYLQRKFDKWRVKIPRNNQLNDSRRDNRLKDRFRSTYFVVELYFQNNNDKEFKINRVISFFDRHSF